MGGTTEPSVSGMTAACQPELPLAQAIAIAVDALSLPAEGDKATEPSRLTAEQLEVAILDRGRPRRAFVRLAEQHISELLTGD